MRKHHVTRREQELSWRPQVRERACNNEQAKRPTGTELEYLDDSHCGKSKRLKACNYKDDSVQNLLLALGCGSLAYTEVSFVFAT